MLEKKGLEKISKLSQINLLIRNFGTFEDNGKV